MGYRTLAECVNDLRARRMLVEIDEELAGLARANAAENAIAADVIVLDVASTADSSSRRTGGGNASRRPMASRFFRCAGVGHVGGNLTIE